MLKAADNPRLAFWTVATVLAFALAVTQWPAFRAELLQSDIQTIQNPMVVGVGAGVNPLSPFYAQIGTPGLPYYRPLTLFTYRLNYGFSGLKPAGFRFLNLVIHYLAVLALFRFILVLAENLWVAAAASLVFGLHPVAASQVGAIAACNELLCALFLLLAWKLHIQAQRLPGRFSPQLFLALLAFLAALASSEKAPIFLGLVILGDLTFHAGSGNVPTADEHKQRFKKALFPGYISYLVLMILFFVWKYGVIGVRPWSMPRVDPVDNPILYQSVGMSLINALKLTGLYLSNTIWQAAPMGNLHEFLPVTSPADLWLLISISILVLAAIVARQLFRKAPAILAPAWIFLLGILPALNVFPRTPHAISDSSMYFPVVAVALGVAYLGDYVRRKKARPALVATLGIAFLLLLGAIDLRSSQRIETEMGQLQFLHSLEPFNVKVASKLTQGLWAFRQGKEAISIMEQVVKGRPDSALALTELARLQASSRIFDEATKNIDLAKKISPPNPEPFIVQGNIYEGTGKDAEAAREYQTALQIQPGYVRAMGLLGILNQRLDRTEEAIRYYRMALEANPASAATCINLGGTLARAGKAQDSIAYYVLAIKLDPSLPEAYLNLGQAYAQQNYLPTAVQVYETALVLFGQNMEVVTRLGQAYLQMQNIDKAVALYRSAIQNNPQEPMLFLHLGNAYRAGGQTDLALEQYNKLIKANPKLMAPYLSMGYMFNSQGKYDKALEAYQKASALDPKNPTPFYNIGNTYRNAKQYPQAVEAYRHTLQVEPVYAEAHYMLGVTLETMGKYTEAIDSFQEFLKTWKGQADLADQTRARIRDLQKKLNKQ